LQGWDANIGIFELRKSAHRVRDEFPAIIGGSRVQLKHF
jgi:hypothetical protein